MSANRRSSAAKSRGDGDASRCNREACQPCSLPRLHTGACKSHATKAAETRKQTPFNRSEDGRTKLPPIGQVETCQLTPRRSLNELNSKNGDLQLKLIVVKTGHRLLKNVLHRHSAALQHYQHLEGSMTQIQNSHINEVKAIQKLLGDTRNSCDALGKKLQDAQKELFDSKVKILQLETQILQSPTLLEKEALGQRLEEAAEEMREKDKRIWTLERNNKLLQSTLHRHVAAEQRKLCRSNEMFYCLQTQVYDLTKEVQERRRESKSHNIPALRLEVVENRKDKINKMIQTDEILPAPKEVECCLKSEPEDNHSSSSSDYLPQRPVAVRYVNRNVQRTRKFPDLKEPPDHQTAGDIIEEKEVTEASQVSEEEDQGEEKRKSPGSCRIDQAIVSTSPTDDKKPERLGLIRRRYVFSPVTENLHMGRPTHSNLEQWGGSSDTEETCGGPTSTQAPAEKPGLNTDEVDDHRANQSDLSSHGGHYS
ncbi:uncharacterized protein [Nerophis lumbriciformis]|uniref:uncharacterized protein n=1 Tax=Nerophis lumbriciformis TaxID=546530 RepID=UPI002ADF48D7|nr:uncharacterized protein LOC133614526 [Nerophis lumbriciformis]